MSIPVPSRDAGLMAAILAQASDDPWSAAYIDSLLAQPGVFAFVAGREGFILVRAAGGEAEILNLAVVPAARRRGIGCALVSRGADESRRRGAGFFFLEVNVGNFAAKNLYFRIGFAEVGRRPGYYRGREGIKEDALVLRASLPLLEV